jgi:hypothetical protein
LTIVSRSGTDNATAAILPSVPAAWFETNVRYYSLGSGNTAFQGSPVPGQDGSAPQLTDYAAAYDVIDRNVDLFNLLLLPRDSGHTAATRLALNGPASAFAQKRRAVLLADAPSTWTSVQAAINPATGVNSVRTGVVKDYTILTMPDVTLLWNGNAVDVGPSGAIAGVIARTDGTRGVWKAPAGTDAYLTGIVGIATPFRNDEHGFLNPEGINTIRVFDGIVNWGARTMDGADAFASQWKYVPVRRTALFIEESLYRGLGWVVFEPNDEPLWAQIRLNVGSFMHDMFRKGAFAGKTPSQAYLVMCDKDTTTPSDQALGIVNVVVGFAPLRPAEFVLIHLQQLTAQAST